MNRRKMGAPENTRAHTHTNAQCRRIAIRSR